ncbi:hypothetical protein SERLA73DRAFT_186974 [Serpula lacrymans var. lacrymans S7.3]|uniref:Uncharacterized protein n=2 Tax=Serpula lacrymans var. lacrymans TaxID=341189 RepID=F8Q871_SERL3|nr:uncharacterized protein SERLADRAFT_476283 [Serpula lacrymans var. lacrymans S7.9]EGN95759.1 hypothetical protein SERLA73DRAFT_186974 [Serpula lacrymans var. lacrymans S7.3]EGO21284.1 hypothetical protein SERLADRAFT_476283 [Serpula lacrymans var. lacrymans S7.9]
MSSTSSLNEAHEANDIEPVSIHVSSPESQPSSIESSLTLAPTILITNATSLRSTCSLPQHAMNVKFAALPKTEPRRKRSLAPLGVSARSRRRQQQQQDSFMWNNDALAQEEEYVEDPFITLGRLVKNASKHLWKRVRKKEKGGEDEKDAGELGDSSDTAPIVDVRRVSVKDGGLPRLDTASVLEEEREDETEGNGDAGADMPSDGLKENASALGDNEESLEAAIQEVFARRYSWSPSLEPRQTVPTDTKRRSTGTVTPPRLIDQEP